jgi:hypothetical protein
MHEALPIFLGDNSTDLNNIESSKLTHIMTWAPCSPIMALSLLCPGLYPPHPTTAQYAVDVLRSYPADVLLIYIQQLVQCVRWDTVRDLALKKKKKLDGICLRFDYMACGSFATTCTSTFVEYAN